jgi:hypothetical protein
MTIQGRIRDARSGAPIEKALVVGNPKTSTETRTDATGAFSLDVLDASEFNLNVHARGYYSAASLFSKGDFVSIQLTPLEMIG